MNNAVTAFDCLMGLYALAGGWFVAFATRDWRQNRRAAIDAPASPIVRFCRDCRWALPKTSGFFGTTRNFTNAKCMHPTSLRSTGDFLASGRYTPENAQYCSVVRGHISRDNECCGVAGMHWEVAGLNPPKLVGNGQ